MFADASMSVYATPEWLKMGKLTGWSPSHNPPALNAKQLGEDGVICPLLRGVMAFINDESLPPDLQEGRDILSPTTDTARNANTASRFARAWWHTE